MSLQNEIAAEAKRLGFTLFGVTVPVAPPHFNVYESWVKHGRHGEMGYLATERAMSRRSDPGLILPGCKSILVLGWPHLIPNLPVQNLESDSYRLTGRIASYAWNEDYHDVIPRKMSQLVDFIEGQVGEKVPHRWYTDTGPILERDLAQQAGLGWIGKNSCLINPGSGSYFLLAEIFLGIKLGTDKPFSADRCGSCTRCIQACPTGCIMGDRTIDASRCISYLTIEMKGAIPVELRPQIQNWVFGCDICQQVCPWNQRFAAPPESIQVDVHLAQPELASELALSPQVFNEKFKGSPVKRTKRRGYLRNVAVALGNSGSTSGVPRLIETLKNDQEPLVRGHAAWALGRIGNQQARRALKTALIDEHDPYVLEEIHSGLGV